MAKKLAIYAALAVVAGVALFLFGDQVGIGALPLQIGLSVLLALPIPISLFVASKKKGKSKPAQPKPQQIAAPRDLLARFDAKIAALEKVLHAARVAGDPTMRQLPRVLVIGPAGSGKSAAIHRSRLEFPFRTAAEGKSSELEIWLSRTAIFFDVTGRYFTAESGLEQVSWHALLGRLAKKKPVGIDALLLAVPLDELLTASSDAAEELAARTRRRAMEAIDAIGWSVPVYVMFTKSDRMAGFIESFEVLPGTERAQTLGFVLGAESNVEDELAELVENVRREARIRLPQLEASYRSPTFSFPEQLASTTEALGTFLRRIGEPNALGDRARLGGVFFASAMQDGKTIDRAFERLSRAFDLSGPPSRGAKIDEPRSFFLYQLFAEVLPARAWELARTELGRRRNLRELAIKLSAGAVLVLAIGGLSTLSFFRNKALLSSTIEVARAIRAPEAEEISPSDYQRLKAIVPLAERIEQLETWELDGPPLSYGFGFYSGSEILVPLRRIFERAMEEMFVDPVSQELDSMLGDQTGSGDVVADYDSLKAYLMLTRESARLDAEIATPVLVEVWKRRLDLSASSDADLLTTLAGTYVRQVGRGRSKWPTASDTTIGEARASLRRRNAEFERMVASARKNAGPPLKLNELVNGRVSDALRSGRDIDRLFTLDGWKKVRGSFQEKPEGAEYWVLGESSRNDEMVAKAKEQYFTSYIAEWHRFLRDLSIREAESLPAAKRVLEELTKRPSILEDLLTGMSQQMKFQSAAEERLAAPPQKGVPKGATKAIGVVNAINEKTSEPTPVEIEFKPLFDLVYPPKEGTAPAIGQLLDKLNAVKGALEKITPESPDTRPLDAAVADAKDAIDVVFLPIPDHLGKLMKPLFLDAMRGASKEAETEKYARANQAFSEKVCDLFHETVARGYPFDRDSADDALIDSVVQFFGPAGAAFTFFEATLKDDFERSGDSIEVKPNTKVEKAVIDFYQKAFLVKGALFPGGVETIAREFQVKPQGITKQPDSSVKATGVTLEIGGEKRTYKFGPEETWNFKWPGELGRARLSLDGANESIEAWGDWALFRLVDKGTVKQLSGGWIEVRFAFKQGQVQVPLHIRAATGSLNPLLEQRKFRIACPRSKTQ